jgi:integrase
MSMTTRAGDYLAMRRSLGYKLRGEGRMLAGFAARLDEEGQATITISAALAWAAESREAAPAHWRRRLSVVRGFARYLATLDPACQIPPADLLPAPSHRPPPYIYSAAEIAALIHAAGTIGAPLPAATMQALIRLIAASGMRVGEALALDRNDAGLDTGTLTVTGKTTRCDWCLCTPPPLPCPPATPPGGTGSARTRPHRRSSSPAPGSGQGSAAYTKPSLGWWPWPASPRRPDGAGPGSTT